MKVVAQLVAWELALVDQLEGLTKAKMSLELLEENWLKDVFGTPHPQVVPIG